jgi:methanogenic corrinoid protein MtbC1
MPKIDAEAAAGEIIEEALKSLRKFDREGLERVLHHASANYSLPDLIEKILSPFLERLGDLWSEGSLRVAQEHLSSGIIRGFLANLSRQNTSSQTEPLLIATTPAGQHHEFGALFAAVVASSSGWRTMYLGPNLPAEEIAGAAEVNGARAVALSIIHPADDPRLAEELMRLRRCLPPDIKIVAGGRSAAVYGGALDAIHAVILNNSAELRSCLNSLRLSS